MKSLILCSEILPLFYQLIHERKEGGSEGGRKGDVREGEGGGKGSEGETKEERLNLFLLSFFVCLGCLQLLRELGFLLRML